MKKVLAMSTLAASALAVDTVWNITIGPGFWNNGSYLNQTSSSPGNGDTGSGAVSHPNMTTNMTDYLSNMTNNLTWFMDDNIVFYEVIDTTALFLPDGSCWVLD